MNPIRAIVTRFGHGLAWLVICPHCGPVFSHPHQPLALTHAAAHVEVWHR